MSKSGLDVPSSKWQHGRTHFRNPAPRHPRQLRTAAITILLILVLKLAWMCRHYRNDLIAKHTKTRYPALTPTDQAYLLKDHWRLGSDAWTYPALKQDYSREQVLAHRDEWQRLTSGFKGEAFIFDGVFIKAYSPTNAPFRNCVPGTDGEFRWPTEISASLVLGGTASSLTVSAEAEWVPIVDYFLAPVQDQQHEKWHLITPLLRNGNLEDLSRRLHKSEERWNAHEIDRAFRHSFERVLSSLNTMHTQDQLCHDDIQLENILVADDIEQVQNQNVTTHWLLADLANVREIEHPYHHTDMWKRSNIPDCRSNDVYRLVKSYIGFLRNSVRDEVKFDQEFFAGETAWSRLFWATWEDVRQRQPISAARITRRSQSLDYEPSSPSRPSGFGSWPTEIFDPVWWSLAGRDKTLARAVSDKLFIGATELPERLWGLMSALGTPAPRC